MSSNAMPELRARGLLCNMPVNLRRNCRPGTGVIGLPNMTIGDDSGIGAGSVVTKGAAFFLRSQVYMSNLLKL